MSDRTKYHITPHDDGWQVKKEGADRASFVGDTQQDAIERGRDLAKNAKPGQLIIHGKDGRIRDEWTYGDDPYPPEG